MADEGKEATFSMGEDTPLAFISQKPRVLYDYFKQRFAQVTNPPIDPLREGLVMSLDSVIGKKGNILQPKAEEARQIKLDSPVLNESNLEEIRSKQEFNTQEISLLFGLNEDLSKQIKKICDDSVEAVKNGSEIIIISDKGITDQQIYIPPVIATGAIHHRLIDEGLRSKASIVVETAQCWSTHHFAVLIGYGASAICPYLTFETIRQNQDKQKKGSELTMVQRQMNYKKSIEAGILKILSKIGISCLSSYQGA
jgi:glutamate synthase (ferredoxin)|tara:strand:+ start:2105 stop:2866 length:762 start_codon:yes stop_codon:yes gene_type:complete